MYSRGIHRTTRGGCSTVLYQNARHDVMMGVREVDAPNRNLLRLSYGLMNQWVNRYHMNIEKCLMREIGQVCLVNNLGDQGYG